MHHHMGNQCPLRGHIPHQLHSLPLAFVRQGQDSKMAEHGLEYQAFPALIQAVWGLTMAGGWWEVDHVVSDLLTPVD